MEGRSRILLVYTGGTIGMVKDYEDGALRPYDFDEMLGHIPEIRQLDCELKGVSVVDPVDSSEMNPERWEEIADLIVEHESETDGFVVLHGTDTMSYTASALSFMLENLVKPVIFTGSQLPIGDLRTDAKQNLITSIQLASLRKNGVPVVQEVGLYFEYALFRANRSTKISAEFFEAFESPNYPHLIEAGVHMHIREEYLYRIPAPGLPLHKADFRYGTVVVLRLYPGISEAFLRAAFFTDNVEAVILETFGSGNAPSSEWFLSVLRDAREKGIYVINVTQCIRGSVVMEKYRTGRNLFGLGVIDGRDSTTESALCKTMYLLGKDLRPAEFKRAFETSLRGEISEL